MEGKIKITIGESYSKGFKPVSWLIKLIEGTDHSHSFVTWKDEHLGVRKVAEARGSGGRVISNWEFRRTNTVSGGHIYYVSEDQLDEIEKFIWTNLGGYSQLQIIGILCMRVQQLMCKLIGCTKKRPSNPFKDGPYSMICVELTARIIDMVKSANLGDSVEDFGLREAHELNLKYRDGFLDKEKIDRINKKTR